jgi:hypothetical protein
MYLYEARWNLSRKNPSEGVETQDLPVGCFGGLENQPNTKGATIPINGSLDDLDLKDIISHINHPQRFLRR